MKKVSYSVLALMFLANLAYAELVTSYKGNFQLDPEVMHKGPITGVMSLLFENSVFTLVQIDLDKPILGSKVYQSKEQSMVTVNREGLAPQMSVVYRLDRPKHNWYFVVVANSPQNEDGTFQKDVFAGHIYKVAATMDEILNLVRDGIDTIPPSWKPVGATTLTATGTVTIE
ncbi:MAG TPA: hypothetical protein VJB34_00790 [Bdellovibrionota bacterium]|nr:hypothetical protein [Bdellovibrionota bacterium]